MGLPACPGTDQHGQTHGQDDITSPSKYAYGVHLANFGKGNGTLLVLWQWPSSEANGFLAKSSSR